MKKYFAHDLLFPHSTEAVYLAEDVDAEVESYKKVIREEFDKREALEDELEKKVAEIDSYKKRLMEG